MQFSAVSHFGEEFPHFNRSIFSYAIVMFVETLKKRLHFLLKTREDNADMPQNWVSREASNIEALQEGGTFK